MTLTYEVLVPAYQAEDSIAATVASALAQRPAPARVLVYSDGSTDRTAERARAAGAEVLDVAENRGVGAARQALLERARAPWLLVLDSDDRLLPDAARLFREAVETHPDAWVLGFGAVTDTAAAPDPGTGLDPARRSTCAACGGATPSSAPPRSSAGSRPSASGGSRRSGGWSTTRSGSSSPATPTPAPGCGTASRR
jgi:GT2 family glycosyltransferase